MLMAERQGIVELQKLEMQISEQATELMKHLNFVKGTTILGVETYCRPGKEVFLFFPTFKLHGCQ